MWLEPRLEARLRILRWVLLRILLKFICHNVKFLKVYK